MYANHYTQRSKELSVFIEHPLASPGSTKNCEWSYLINGASDLIPKSRASISYQLYSAAAIPLWKLCRGKISIQGNRSVQPELRSNPQCLYNHKGTDEQNWHNVVALNGGLQVYTESPCLKIFPPHNFQNLDYLCILAHTFGNGLLLLMAVSPLISMARNRAP